MKFGRQILVVALLIPVVLMAGHFWHDSRSPVKLRLNFEAMVGGEPLEFNQIRYYNPNGEGQFKVRDFLFYISNIKLIGESVAYVEPDSYHLARFDNQYKSYTIEIENIPRANYSRIEFSIGVDQAANSSIEPRGDLDANSRMAWSWDVGYKFIIFEGGLLLKETVYPLVYHVGFNENYKLIRTELDRPLFVEPVDSLHFKVDIMKIFTGTTSIDMSALSSVKFDKTDAKTIADNYANMVLYCASCEEK